MQTSQLKITAISWHCYLGLEAMSTVLKSKDFKSLTYYGKDIMVTWGH